MKKKAAVIFLFCLTISFSAFSQKPTEKLKKVYLNGEYFFLYEDFEEALFSYNTLYQNGYSENGNINYRIGQCYLNIPGEKTKAIKYLEKAVNYASSSYTEGSFKETNAPLDAWYYLGIAYRIDKQLDKAVTCFQKFKELIGDKTNKAFRLAEKEIYSCEYAKLAMTRPYKVDFVNLGRPVSTGSNDFFPVVSGDESVLVYNSAQKFYTAVFFSKKVNNKWTPPVNITPEIQSDGNQFVSSISFDGSKLFLRYEDNFEANIYMASYENGRWNKSKPLNGNINTKFYEGNACISKEGDILYFSSNRNGGFGAMDIYYSKKQSNGNWGPAVNIGSSINSELNEDAPFITEDGNKLYFISQNHNSIGGYDIYYSLKDSAGNWKTPENLGYPVNTTDDDLFFQPVRNGEIGYTSLYASNGLGKQDIYRLHIYGLDTTKINIIDTTRKVIAGNINQKEPVLTDDVIDAIASSDTTRKKEQIILRNIFFDFNSFVLNETSKKELDHLAIVMNNYPEIKIKFVGTADPLGKSQYNMQLSFKRALSVKNYLIAKGIKNSRMVITGVGESNFIAINIFPDGSDCPEGRKYNRRVEIHLLDTVLDNIMVEPINVPDNLKIK